MSEITTVMTVEMTFVQKVNGEAVSNIISADQNEELQRVFAQTLKREYGMDNVNVAKVQSFVREDN